jgi:hypothetical protein
MKTQKLGSALLLVLMSSTSSWAAATTEEAARIQATFQTYIGAEPGVLTVAPNGDAYDIAIDIAPYLKKVTTVGFTSKVDPFKFQVTPKGDGTWAVTSTGPYNASAEVPDLFNFSVGIQNQNWSGTYSEALSSFADSKYEMSGLTMSQRSIDPQSKMISSTATAIEILSGESTATDAGNSTANASSTFEFSGLVTSTTIDLPPEMAQAGMPSMNYVATVPKGNYVTSAKGQSTKALMELAAFFVARPSKELLVKDQAILKEKLLAALPFFASIEGNSTFENMTVETSVGKFTVASVGASVGANGAVKEGRFAESFSLTGLTLPEGLPLPPWSKGLVPTNISIGFDLSDFDLEAPVRKFITEMDISKDEPVPPGSEAAYIAAVAPKNSVKVTIPPGEISADIYTLKYEGVTDISFAGLPKVTAKVSMKGMDAVITQLQQAATDPTAQQAMAGLFAMKGIGKANGDETVWDITMGADGKLLVNGTDISAMMGAMSPPQQ